MVVVAKAQTLPHMFFLLYIANTQSLRILETSLLVDRILTNACLPSTTTSVGPCNDANALPCQN